MKVKQWINKTRLYFVYKATVHNTTDEVDRFCYEFKRNVYADKFVGYIYSEPANNLAEIKYDGGVLYVSKLEVEIEINNIFGSYKAWKTLIRTANEQLKVQDGYSLIGVARTFSRNHFIDNGGDFDSL